MPVKERVLVDVVFNPAEDFCETLRRIDQTLSVWLQNGWIISKNPFIQSQGYGYSFELVRSGSEAVAPVPVEARNPYLDLSIDEIDFTVRTYNCLKNANIRTVEQLVTKTSRELLQVKNMGPKCVKEIRDHLNKHDLSLAEKPS